MPKPRLKSGKVPVGNNKPHANTIMLNEDSYPTKQRDAFWEQFYDEELKTFKDCAGLQELTNSITKEIKKEATFRSEKPWVMQRNSYLNNYTDMKYLKVKQNHQYIRIELTHYQDRFNAPIKVYVLASTKYKLCQQILEQDPKNVTIWSKIRPRICEIWTARTFSREINDIDRLKIYEVAPWITDDKVRNFKWYFIVYTHVYK